MENEWDDDAYSEAQEFVDRMLEILKKPMIESFLHGFNFAVEWEKKHGQATGSHN